MVYCPSCGKQNPDDARYCNNCGADLTTGARGPRRREEDRCNEECSGRGKGGLLFWGVIVALIGIGIIISAISNYLPNPPSWLVDFNWWWLVLVVIGVAVLVAGVRMLIRASKNQ
jgi:uncharacterized membrane protein YvbJ